MAASDDMGGDNVDNSTKCKPLVRVTRQMCPQGDKPRRAALPPSRLVKPGRYDHPLRPG
jgi:hypothetical protein